jgi:hypothetical protein
MSRALVDEIGRAKSPVITLDAADVNASFSFGLSAAKTMSPGLAELMLAIPEIGIEPSPSSEAPQ